MIRVLLITIPTRRKKTYDANNNLATLAYTYDGSARETSRHYGNLYSQQSAYDKNANVLKEDIVFNNTTRIKSYTFDAQDHLTKDAANDQCFLYDLNGNISHLNTKIDDVVELLPPQSRAPPQISLFE
jgi:hypothetical protein